MPRDAGVTSAQGGIDGGAWLLSVSDAWLGNLVSRGKGLAVYIMTSTLLNVAALQVLALMSTTRIHQQPQPQFYLHLISSHLRKRIQDK